MPLPPLRQRHSELADSLDQRPPQDGTALWSQPTRPTNAPSLEMGRYGQGIRRQDGASQRSSGGFFRGNRTFVFLATGFIAVQLLLLFRMGQSPGHENAVRFGKDDNAGLIIDSEPHVAANKQLLMKPPPHSRHKPPPREHSIPGPPTKSAVSKVPSPKDMSPVTLRAWAATLNEDQHILNSDVFFTEDIAQMVIMIQAHSRTSDLEHLLSSLSNVKGISSVLLIISSDLYSQDFLRVVESVKFCRVLPIFFPFSSQLFPDSFPGTDPRDCARDAVSREGCLGDPDRYGHFRETKFTAIKHHWWWKLNFVFNGQLHGVVPDHTRVILLEEDYLVSPDILQTLDQVDRLRTQLPEVDLISMGTYFRKGANIESEFQSWRSTLSLTSVAPFVSATSNMGMVVDYDFWQKMHTCTEAFCRWEDYNWDWSTQALQTACRTMGTINVLQLRSGRVFHAGGCSGIHNSAPSCDSGLEVYLQQLQRMEALEFPSALTLVPNTRQGKPSPPYVNGGWGDKRDHALCMYFAGMGEPPVDLPVLKQRISSAVEGVGDALQLQPVVPESPRGSPKRQGVLQHLMDKVVPSFPSLSFAHPPAAPLALEKHAASGIQPLEDEQEQAAGEQGLDADSGLGIDPWARSSQAAKESVFNGVNRLLMPEEKSQLLELCGRCLYHPISTAVALRGLGQDAHVSTGDIPDMWLRDSAFEIAIYMPRMVAKPAFRLAVEGTIRRHAFDITMDPYACGFSWKWWDPNVEVDEFNRRQGRGGWVAIRSFEIDSGAYFMNLLWDYFNTDGLYRPETLIGETLVHDAVSHMVDTYIVEQRHMEHSPYLAHDLPNGGKGNPVKYTGMVWSGYRASDDATRYGYNIPDNMFLVGALERMIVLNSKVWKDDSLHGRMARLKAEVQDGLTTHAIVVVDGVEVYAYEVDGLGNSLVDFDDPNLPSLMSIPLLGYQHFDQRVYDVTRERLFAHNKYYVRGSHFEGWASPHTPNGQVWHLGWITQGLTSDSVDERVKMLRNLLKAQCGNNLMHETVNVDNPARCTRNWFEWANAMLVVFVENSLGESCDLHGDIEFEKSIVQREATSRKRLPSAKFYENFEQHVHHADRSDFTKLTNPKM